MSQENEIIDPQEKRRIRRANIIAFLIEFVIIVVYLVVGFGGLIDGMQDFDIAGMLQSVSTAIWILVCATLASAIVFLTVKPLRTKTTIKWAIFDFVWAIVSIIGLVQ